MGAWNLLLFPILTDMVLTVALPPIDAVLLTGAASADAGVTAFDVAKDIGHTVVVGGAVLGDVALLTGAAAVDAARFSVTAPIEYTRGLFHTSGAIEPEDLGILSSSPIELDSGDASTFSLTAGDSVSLPFAFQAGSLAVDAEALSKIVVDVIQERGQQAPTIRLSLQSKSTPALRANSVISLATLVEGIAHQKNTKSATAARLFLEEVVRETASESVHASAVAAFRQLGVSVAVSEDELDLQFASNRSIYGIAPDGAYVDWASPQHMVRPPMPRLQMDLAGSLATNSKLTVFLTVYNDGDGDLFRVAANLKSDLRDFDGRRILFGRVPARSHIRRSFAGDIPTTLDGSSDPRLEVAIEEGNGFTPDPIARLLAIRRVLPAQLEHTLEVLDDGHFGSLGNGNGILDPRETAAIILHVRNDGDATAENIRLDGQVNCDLSDVSLFPLVQSNLEKAVSCSTSDCKFSCEIPILERGRVQAIGFLVSLKKSFRGKGVPIALRIRYDHGVTREWPVDNVPVGADRPERPYQFSPERHARVKNENSSLPLVATPSRQGLVLLTVESGSIHKVLAWLGGYSHLPVLTL